MISPVKMLERVRARLAKDRRVILRLKNELAVSRNHTRRLRHQVRGLRAGNAELERQRRAQERAARKAQLKLPLAPRKELVHAVDCDMDDDCTCSPKEAR